MKAGTPKWSEHEVETLRVLARQNWPGRKIAERLGRSERAVFVFAMRIGIEIRGPKFSYSDSESALVRQLAAEGKSSTEIAQHVARGERSVASWCFRNGVTLQRRKSLDWSPQEIQTLRQMIEAGEPHGKIAEALGRGINAVRQKALECDLRRRNVWPAEKEQRLRELVAKNISFSEIAELLGVTRNTVAGKCARMKLRLSAPRVAMGEEARREQRRLQKKRARDKYIERGLNSRGKVRSPMGPKRQAAAGDRALNTLRVWNRPDDPGIRPDAPRGAGPAILELRNCACHWPHGHPDSEDFTFCYAPRSRAAPQIPYCDFHIERSRARSPIHALDLV